MPEKIQEIKSDQKLITQKFIDDINANFRRCIYKVIAGNGIDVTPETGQRGSVTISLDQKPVDG